MAKIVTLGEIMLRLSTPGHYRFIQSESFDAVMAGADWFHWSGITPAISDRAAELTRLACEAAKRHGVTVSVTSISARSYGRRKRLSLS